MRDACITLPPERDRAIDAWIRQMLAQRFESALNEPLPREWLALLTRS